MTAQEAVVAKVRCLPEPLAQEVNDYVDFLIARRDAAQWQFWTQFSEGMQLAEGDFSDYLPQLEAYEDQLARGEIKW